MSEPQGKAGVGKTYQAIADKLLETEPRDSPEAKKDARVARRLLWLCHMANWPSETTMASRHAVTAFFDENRPATFGLTKGSYAVYRSEILSVLKPDPVRKHRYILQMTGIWREVHDLTVQADLPPAFRWRCSPLLWFLDERDISPAEVTPEILMDFYRFSLTTEMLEEDRARRRALDAAKYITLLSDLPEFAKFGFSPVEVRFRNRSIKYNVPADIANPLLADFDCRVAPWARGEMSNIGERREDYLKRRDDEAVPATISDKKRRWKTGAAYQGRRAREKDTRTGTAEGFVPSSNRWNDATVKSARASISTCVKALYEAEGYRIETIEELTDPEIVEAYAAILHTRQKGKKHPSSYVKHILTVINGLAKRFVGRSQDDIESIAEIRATYTISRRGIAPRNREKLQNFTPARIQTLIDMPDLLLRQINREVKHRREAHRTSHGVLPRPEEVYGIRLIREVMIILAHHIMLARAPRRANLSGIKLDWLRWRDGLVTIEIPWHVVKKRKEVDGPLPIPLSADTSCLLKSYQEKLRPKILHPDDPENPYLFPSPPHAGEHRIGECYLGLPDRLVDRIHDVVGVQIHPHLSRHLLGWIWLRENPEKLPSVQKLLGHKHMQTTIDYYAEIDESVALNQWQEFLNAKKT